MFKPDFLYALIGGIFIGLAAAGMLLANGRIMGISGIVGGLLRPQTKDILWRGMFLLGMLAGGLAIPHLGFTIMETPFDRGLAAAIGGGLFVGVGTALGNGCTSGHGVCGISRFSIRSIAATMTFMVLGIAAVALFNFAVGGL